jgi:hypothetical protein
MNENIFADDWHECLKAHYMHVVRTNDRVTLPSLTLVMGQAGFSESDLADLRVRATMHVDEVGADFVPDLDALSQPTSSEAQAIAVPEMPEVEAGDEVILDNDLEPAPENVIEPVIEEVLEDDPDTPQQLSLF